MATLSAITSTSSWAATTTDSGSSSGARAGGAGAAAPSRRQGKRVAGVDPRDQRRRRERDDERRHRAGLRARRARRQAEAQEDPLVARVGAVQGHAQIRKATSATARPSPSSASAPVRRERARHAPVRASQMHGRGRRSSRSPPSRRATPGRGCALRAARPADRSRSSPSRPGSGPRSCPGPTPSSGWSRPHLQAGEVLARAPAQGAVCERGAARAGCRRRARRPAAAGSAGRTSVPERDRAARRPTARTRQPHALQHADHDGDDHQRDQRGARLGVDQRDDADEPRAAPRTGAGSARLDAERGRRRAPQRWRGPGRTGWG